MATTLYILSQAHVNIPVGKREIEHWPLDDNRSHPDSARQVNPVGHEEVKVVICDGDVYVKLHNGETVRRSYIDITQCHLCKLDRSFPCADDDFPMASCVFCTSRTESYHRVAELRVRHCLKMGYQHMYGPFNLAGTAPFPFPHLDDATPEQIDEILVDCQADLKVGQNTLSSLRGHVVRSYQQTGGHQKMMLVRKFGPGVFKPVNEGARKEDGEKNVETRLKDGERELRELRIDIKLYRKILAYEKRMRGGRR